MWREKKLPCKKIQFLSMTDFLIFPMTDVEKYEILPNVEKVLSQLTRFWVETIDNCVFGEKVTNIRYGVEQQRPVPRAFWQQRGPRGLFVFILATTPELWNNVYMSQVKYHYFPFSSWPNFGQNFSLEERMIIINHGAHVIIETWFIDLLQLEKFLLKLPRKNAIIAL